MLTCDNVSLKNAKENLFKCFGINIFPGSITYIRGKNGSGKTSLLRIIANIQEPTNGRILWYGENINFLNKPFCTYIGHKIAFHTEMKVIEVLRFWADLYQTTAKIPAAIEYLQLANIISQPCYQLSTGNIKKVTLSRLFLNDNELWLLDEIDTNLDNDNLTLLQKCIEAKKDSGGVVILASHLPSLCKNFQEIQLGDFK